MGVFDRSTDLGEQTVYRCGKFGHVIANDARRRAGKVALLNGEQPVAESGQGTGALTVRPFGGDIADQQAEGAGDDRRNDLFVEAGDVDEGRQ